MTEIIFTIGRLSKSSTTQICKELQLRAPLCWTCDVSVLKVLRQYRLSNESFRLPTYLIQMVFCILCILKMFFSNFTVSQFSAEVQPFIVLKNVISTIFGPWVKSGLTYVRVWSYFCSLIVTILCIVKKVKWSTYSPFFILKQALQLCV